MKKIIYFLYLIKKNLIGFDRWNHFVFDFIDSYARIFRSTRLLSSSQVFLAIFEYDFDNHTNDDLSRIKN